MISAGLAELNRAVAGDSDPPWYVKEDFLGLAVQALNVISSIVKAEKPAIALAIDTIVATANAPLNKRQPSVDLLRAELDVLTQQLKYITEPNSDEYRRIDAQIDLLMKLLKEKDRNG